MDDDKKPTEKIVEVAGEIFETYKNLMTINVVERASLGVSWSVVGILVLVLSVFVMLFAGMGSAWWLGERMDNMKAGFFIVGGVYLALFLIVAVKAKTWIVPQLRNMLIKKVYEDN